MQICISLNMKEMQPAGIIGKLIALEFDDLLKAVKNKLRVQSMLTYYR